MSGGPIVLAASAALTPAGNVAINNADLKVDTSRAIRIRELNFTIQSGPVGAKSAHVDLGGSVFANVKIGKFDLTNGFVPVWCLGPRYSSMLEGGSAGFIGAGNIGVSGAITTAQYAYYSHMRWIFPKPMHTGVGSAIRILLQRTADMDTVYGVNFNAQNYTVTTSAVAEYTDESPDTIVAPYAMAFVPSLTQLQSQEKDFENTFKIPLQIVRFVGRMVASNGVVDEWITPSQRWTVAARDNDGRIISPVTEWENLFSPDQKSWVFNRELKVGGSYIFTLGALPANATGRAHIGVLGYRTERAH